MSNSAKRANAMLEGLQGKQQEEASQKKPVSTNQGRTQETAIQRDPRGRKKKIDSKRSRLASGELSKLSVLVTTELHVALNVMAAKDPSRDMSDIVTEILKKNVKTE